MRARKRPIIILAGSFKQIADGLGLREAEISRAVALGELPAFKCGVRKRILARHALSWFTRKFPRVY